MPGARRNPGRNTPGGRTQSTNVCQSSHTANGMSSTGSMVDEKKSTEVQINGRLLAPKHVPMPSVPVDGQLMFEALSLGTSIIAASLQLLNLYRTVWWLPQSYNEYTMNFYLIDPYLLVFIVAMITRRFAYALLRRLIDAICPTKWLPMAHRVMRVILLLIIVSILMWCVYYINERHHWIKVLYLCYPSILVYFCLFRIRIGPFFDISTSPLCGKDDHKPLHNCSLNAPAIRAEVSCLCKDFNRRLKRAVFASSSSAYMCGIAPVIFVPQHLHFNNIWVVQHAILFWLGRLSAHFAQAYPVRYCDVLHRAALHLGKWSKVEARNVNVPCQTWSDSVLWPHGSYVQYNEEMYRSEGLCTAAKPGDTSHFRFYILFSNPTILLCSLLGLQLLVIASQLLILIRTVEWYQIISMKLLLVTNYYTLFKLARDYLICWKVYRAEQIVQEKAQTAISVNQ